MRKIGRGRLFVVSAPSGAGKTTVVRGAMRKLPSVRMSVSWTTRKPRKGERDGIDYRFVSKDKFRKLISKEGLIEWAKVFGEYYGTPLANITVAKKDKVDLFLVIDVQGAQQIKKKVKDAVLIFILPPSLKNLEERLKKRGKETLEEIKKRLKKAKWEISKSKMYDYKIVNDKLKKAVLELVKVVNSTRRRLGKNL